jgi:tetratricopeptide (TPR) repeat protein
LASVEALVDGAGTVLEAAAVLRLNDGDLAGAIVAYRRQLEVDPNNSAAHRRLGELYGQQGRLDAALGEFAAALLADPASADGHASRAQALLRLGRFGDAEAAARRAVALQPRHEAALYALGTALVRLDQHDEGARVLEQFEALRAVSRAREERDWQLARLKDEAGQRVDQGDYGGAAALLRQAAALAPDDPAILLAAGAVLVRSGQHEAAIPLLTRALALRETPEGRRYLSEARAAMGR